MSKDMNPISRTAVREHIFKIIFTKEFRQAPQMEEQILLYLDNLTDDDGSQIVLNENDRKYISEKAGKVLENIEKIDEIINKNSKGWSVERLGKAELSILRVAVYEILFDDDIPGNVAINEAIELSKRYGEADAPAFVNGILAAVKS